MDFSKINKVHIVGIGGIGVSAVAKIFLEQKKTVTGSDISPSQPVTRYAVAESRDKVRLYCQPVAISTIRNLTTNEVAYIDFSVQKKSPPRALTR